MMKMPKLRLLLVSFLGLFSLPVLVFAAGGGTHQAHTHKLSQTGEISLPTGQIPGLQIWVSEPRPFDLNTCSIQPPRNSADHQWQELGQTVHLRWAGRLASIPGVAQVEPVANLAERCFRLTLDGRTIVYGSVLSRYSARLVLGPVLFDWTNKHSPATELHLEGMNGVGTPLVFAFYEGYLNRRFRVPLLEPEESQFH